MTAPARIELKERWSRFSRGLLLMFVLFFLTASGWLFYHREAMGMGWFLPIIPLIPGVGGVVVLLYQRYGQKYLLMSSEATHYHCRFFCIRRTREFPTRRLELSVKERHIGNHDERGIQIMYTVVLSFCGVHQELAEFHSRTKAQQIYEQIEQQRDRLIS